MATKEGMEVAKDKQPAAQPIPDAPQRKEYTEEQLKTLKDYKKSSVYK